MDEQTSAPGTTPPPAPGSNWAAPPPPPRRPGFNWADFFAFRYMITPQIIRVVYVIGVVLVTLAALASVNSFGFGGGGILSALFLLVIGNLYLRVIMELLVVFFGMHESLRSIERQDRR
jgi:hypothetical protein